MEIIKLNVGGKVFTTMKSTLKNSPWFVIFFSGKFKTEKINGGEYFIDRDPKIFHAVLNYLRNGKNIHLSYFKDSKCDFHSFVRECGYFGMTVNEKWLPDKLPDFCNFKNIQMYAVSVNTKYNQHNSNAKQYFGSTWDNNIYFSQMTWCNFLVMVIKRYFILNKIKHFRVDGVEKREEVKA